MCPAARVLSEKPEYPGQCAYNCSFFLGPGKKKEKKERRKKTKLSARKIPPGVSGVQERSFLRSFTRFCGRSLSKREKEGGEERKKERGNEVRCRCR